jgi:hypothetical protein
MTLSVKRLSMTSSSGEIVIHALMVRRSTPSRRLQRSPLRRSGIMGMASSGKYTEVPRRRASASRGPFSGT